jgi:hypothetical protein
VSVASASSSGRCVALEIVDLAYPPGDIDAIMLGSVVFTARGVWTNSRSSERSSRPSDLRLDDIIHRARETDVTPNLDRRRVADTLGQFDETLPARWPAWACGTARS